MNIKTLTINSRQEVIVKIVREVINLFKIRITGPREETDYEQISVVNRRLPGDLPTVETKLILFDRTGREQVFRYVDTGTADEHERACVHRLVKLNLYRIFLHDLGMEPAPWGILHGVRPTKIVHRWIRAGLDEEAIVRRLRADYACSEEKARLITPMAFRQLPFLATSDEKTVSVYIGIPFCLTRCLYCSFPSNVLPKRPVLQEFMQALSKDIASVKTAIDRYGLHVQNIYIGGGTPTSLPDDLFREMVSLVVKAFYHPGIVEFTVEAGRPDSLTSDKIACMKEYGVTRVSVNPQTMQLRTLQRIGRQHTPDDIVTMFHSLREAGIPHINMDLILGLPGETEADVRDTMEKVTALHPDDITLHALALKRGSRLKRIMEETHVELPGDAETRRMSKTALAFIDKCGMKPYYLYRQGYMSGDLENIGCCLPGAEGMYNIQIMEEHQTIFGMGGAAATKVVDHRAHRIRSVFNAKDLVTYLRDIDEYIEKRRLLLEEVYGK